MHEVFCICCDVFFENDTKDNGNFMAECVECGEWYHRKCTEIPIDIFKDSNKVWTCFNCIK